ncbi:MAG: VOC family protein [Chloroflexi bacterium]|nr:VOC family protein [Chloroflexota bacterium]
MVFNGVDHIAIVVANTEEALAFYRDILGFPVVVSEVVNDPPVRLTHLDMGNVQLQLVQPMRDDHPLHTFLQQRGEGLHHICFAVDDVPQAMDDLEQTGLVPQKKTPHSGPLGRQAAFVEPAHTRGVLLEITNA